jgi:hypothetical protein
MERNSPHRVSNPRPSGLHCPIKCLTFGGEIAVMCSCAPGVCGRESWFPGHEGSSGGRVRQADSWPSRGVGRRARWQCSVPSVRGGKAVEAARRKGCCLRLQTPDLLCSRLVSPGTSSSSRRIGLKWLLSAQGHVMVSVQPVAQWYSTWGTRRYLRVYAKSLRGCVKLKKKIISL